MAEKLTGGFYFYVVLSILNTAFVLAATASLEIYEKFAQRLLKQIAPNQSFQTALWILIGAYVIVAGGMCMAVTVKIDNILQSSGAPEAKSILHYSFVPDFVLGTIILVFILVGMYKSFKKRGFSLLAGLSFPVILLVIIEQWVGSFKPPDYNLGGYRLALSLSANIMFSVVYIALIVSWMYQKALNTSLQSASLCSELLIVNLMYQKALSTITVQEPYLKILAPNGHDDFRIEVGYSLQEIKTIRLKGEKSYLRILETAVKKRLGKSLDTKKLYPLDIAGRKVNSNDTTAEIRQDFSQILDVTRVDPLYMEAKAGSRDLRVEPDNIIFEPGIRSKESWKHADFAKHVFDLSKDLLEDNKIQLSEKSTSQE